MTEGEILGRYTGLLRDLLSNDSIELRMDTRRDEVEGWDSFTYVNFIVAAEMEFGVKFGVAEIESFENVGAVVRRTKALLG
jgi:acyl carrier protein